MASSSAQIPPDPRLDGKIARYDRDEIISQLESFYKFLPHIPTLAVQRAPPGGWPSITAEILEQHGIHKTPEAINLLRHLPYISMENGTRPYFVPDGFVCDYRLFATEDLTKYNKHNWMSLVKRGDGGTFDGKDEKWPPWVIQLSAGTDREGQCFMLDTTDGTVTKYTVIHFLFKPTYDKDDPRSWRDRMCDDETRVLSDQIERWKNYYLNLELCALPPTVRFIGSVEDPMIFIRRPGDQPGDPHWEETEGLRKIYTEYGWPDNYDKERCCEAMVKWWQSQ
ncbi:uncharacterized protein F4822DRAFT_65251 [Hypoxylon trugodes]|uniref:uncharacterized protein n=1 Tax=Hypoxylon trugodes TaxID=326681 RepID=UPI00218F1FA8|nr:uncharacterized protein F4822DRAFT_65251 [Hypoxylon trugodes]KAI1384275.1 hypothetical protein F4822DRAFT_65251 [Hypoxylon trugodes]